MLGTCGVGFRKLQGHGLYLFVVLSGMNSVGPLNSLSSARLLPFSLPLELSFETSLQHVASRGQWHLDK